MTESVVYRSRHPVPSSREETGVLNGPIVEEEEVRLGDYWQVLKKHGWLIITFFLAVVIATTTGLLLVTPIYKAGTTILIEPQSPQVLDIKEVLSQSLESLGPLNEYDYYKTQYEILKSRSLAAQVIKEQGLENNPLFTGKGQEGFVTKLWTEARAWVKQFFPSAPIVEGDNPFGVNPELIDLYIDEMLEINPISRTRLVQIAFSTPDPTFSARLANAHAQAYIRQGLGMRNRASEEAQRFLQSNLVELKKRVENSEAVLNSYRHDKKIISLDDKENIVVERLADLNQRLTGAEAERIALEAQVHLIRKRDYDSLPAIIDNLLIKDLKQQLARLEGEYAHLSTRFKLDYPRLAQLHAQVEEMRRRLWKETQKVVGGIESAYLAAQANESELRTKMEEQKAAALSLKDASVEYAILAREVDTNLQLYHSVLQRMKEMRVAAELYASNVSVIDEAAPPLEAAKPKKSFSLLLSAFVGLMGGVGLAFFLEYMDNTLKTPQEAERYLQLPRLGVVPDFFRVDRRTAVSQTLSLPSSPSLSLPSSGKELILAHRPLSLITEAYRSLRTAILLSRAEEPPKTILFTSSAQGEGKTTTVLNTALVFAQMRVRVLVIDADLRRSGCHDVLGVGNGLGLTEVLTGQKEVDEVITPLDTQYLFFLSSGSLSPNPTELVGSRKMSDTLTYLQAHYDYILIDSPPVMPVSDAMLLATMVDGVVLVVDGHKKTPKQMVREARSRLTYARANILGIVLNRVNIQTGNHAYYFNAAS